MAATALASPRSHAVYSRRVESNYAFHFDGKQRECNAVLFRLFVINEFN